ncbi:ScbR family autoregulator-binding transcription factor [Streptomyces sp. NPDC057638]|uniref:ScbR family autoregulator-binding transcription factor n=1 Tax=Streptomyces sp. NPDC057638 TaxID=3346190 RepID=UPI0036B4BEA1
MAEPKQERAVRTREAILYAAAEIFDAYGYTGASISKIMERAQVTQGGMYFHFKSKLGLAQAVLAHQQEFVHVPEAPPGLQGLIDLNFFLAAELQNNVLFRASVRLAVEQGDFGMRDDTAYQEWVDQFHTLLCAARERGELLPDVDEREFANVLVGAYSGTQVFSNVASGRADLPQRLVSLWRYLLPAVATEETRARLRLPGGAGRLAA